MNFVLAKKSKNNTHTITSELPASRIAEQASTPTAIENEIECPRCYDVMTLCSDFDSLYYLCETCDFYLYTIKK